MINFDDIKNEHKTEHNLNWPYILDHPYRKLIIEDSGSGKTKTLLNFIITINQLLIIKHLYAKGSYEEKYQFLIKKREKVGLNLFNDSKAFNECSNDMQDVNKNIK